MRLSGRTFVWLVFVSVSTASLYCGSIFAGPQKDDSCTESKVIQEACANLDWVDAEQKKPFIAERINTTVTTAEFETQRYQQIELVARDTAGRIREEYHIWQGEDARTGFPPKMALGGIPSSHHDLNVDDRGQFRVSILDCFGANKIQLEPSSQIAIVQRACVPTYQPSDRAYSDKVIQFLTTNYVDTVVEDLGSKQQGLVQNGLGANPLQTIQVRGVKITWLGGERDGNWKGKPIGVWEGWISDELGVTLHWTMSNVIKHFETHSTLQNIRREEPDAALFSVPSGYKVTSWQ
jgi:hypothetical protein